MQLALTEPSKSLFSSLEEKKYADILTATATARKTKNTATLVKVSPPRIKFIACRFRTRRDAELTEACSELSDESSSCWKIDSDGSILSLLVLCFVFGAIDMVSLIWICGCGLWVSSSNFFSMFLGLFSQGSLAELTEVGALFSLFFGARPKCNSRTSVVCRLHRWPLLSPFGLTMILWALSHSEHSGYMRT